MSAFFAFGHGAEELLRRVLGVAGHEADEKLARNVVYHAYEVGKIRFAAEVAAVGVYVLPQQGYVLVAVGDELPRLGHDILRTAGALPAADVWHDAVGAEIIAAVHDRQPRLDLPVAL